MAEYHGILDGQRGRWTLIVLLIVVAIIALLMVLYLPSVLQSYSPPTTTDEEGTTKPILEYVEDQLAPIDTRNQQLEDYLPPQDSRENDQPQGQNQ